MFKNAGIVFRKEIKDIFRDRKSMIMQILIPLIIFPLIGLIMMLVMGNIEKDMNTVSEIALISEGNSGIAKYIESRSEDVKVVQSEDIEKDLRDNEIKAAVYIDENFEKDIAEGRKGKVEIKYMDSSMKSNAAEAKLRNIFDSYSKEIVSERLKAAGIDEEILEPLELKTEALKTEERDEAGSGLIIFSIVVPMLLSIYAITGSISYAVDLGVGEKERQTLEPLLTTKTDRISILIGKYAAIVLSSLVATGAALAGLGITTVIAPQMMGEYSGFDISMVIMAILLFLGLSLVFSGLELAISFYARNFKEAQTYLSPITVLVIIPAYASIGIDAFAIPYKYFHIPVLNVILLFKEAIYGIYDLKHIATVFGWIIVYIAASLVFTVKMFKSEKVIFRN